MCGRITQTSSAKTLAELFLLMEEDIPEAPERYNLAPSQEARCLRDEGKMDLLRWGLIPPWASSPKVGYNMINARGETLLEKRSFANPFRRQRCIVPVDGYFEWKKEGENKQPYYIYEKHHKPLALAGLWENWTTPEGPTWSTFTIITTSANEGIASIHHRMPVILSKDDFAMWLDPEIHESSLLSPMIKPCPPDWLQAHPVSRAVGNPRNQGPELIKEVPPAKAPPREQQLQLFDP